MKKIGTFFVLFFVLLFGYTATGYDNMINHPKFARLAADIYNASSSKPLTSDQSSWIVAGAVKEDADPRYLRHFYNYKTGAGFGIWPNAASWTQAQDTSLGDFSEKAILSAYKEGDEQLAYIGIGHQLHLIEDMAVPAHVRDDPHNPDLYEEWSQKNSPDISSPQIIKIESLSSAIISLAKNTGNNFYSNDTIDGNIANGSIEKDRNGDEYEIRNNYKLARVKNLRSNKVYSLNEVVHKDYYNQLAPKAVGYSAGVIDYFQKKFAVIDQEKKKDGKVVAFFKSIYEYIADPLAGLKIAYGDTINALNVNFQISKNQAIQDELDADPQLKHDLQTSILSSNHPIINQFAKSVVQKGYIAPATASGKNVLGEKIVASSTPGVFTVVQDPHPLVVQVGLRDDTNVSNTANKIVIDIIPPDIAAELDNPNLAAPVRTTPIPIFDAPTNSEPLTLSEPIIYPETQILSQPLTIGNSPLAIFAFGSDQASSTYEFTLGPVSSTTVWISVGPVITLEKLTDGPHSLFVRAVYKAVIDQTPAEYSWVIDTVAPSSQFASLDKYYNQSSFPISWSRTDSGTDEAYFNIDFATTTGEWVAYEHATTATSTLFAGNVQPGDTVGFRVQACDVLGNCESLATTSQAATRVGPVMPATTTLSLISASGQSSQVTWNTPNDANLELATTAQYELKYKIKNGSCNLAANWETASSSTGLPTPQLSAGGAESFAFNNLSAGTSYCAAIRTNNGANWSELSNVLEFRTNCNDTSPRATNYTTHPSKASTSSVPNQTPESILVVDYTNHIINYIYKGMIMVDFGVYDFFGGNTCGQIAERAITFYDPASTFTRIEIAYDPATKLFTGQYRVCENGWHYTVKVPEGDHCRDNATAWSTSRWHYLPSLKDQSMTALRRTRSNQYTEWLKIP